MWQSKSLEMELALRTCPATWVSDILDIIEPEKAQMQKLSHSSPVLPMALSLPTGKLINAHELMRSINEDAHCHINTESDSELMMNIYANDLGGTGKARVNSDGIVEALRRTYGRLEDGWTCTAMIPGFAIIGFRDSYGIPPLVLGSRRSLEGEGMDYILASEYVALKQVGYKDIQDISPGQAVII